VGSTRTTEGSGGETRQIPPCSAPEARQLDFWLGVWDCTWDGGGRGSNRIRAVLDGCAIEERFDAAPTAEFRGMSLSMYVPALGRWRQTWVDNAGNHFDLVGGMEQGTMVLACEEPGTTARLRMVFFNVERDRLDWRWERSEDGGATWQTLWRIHYRRKGVPEDR
jgi:hypothetical protein